MDLTCSICLEEITNFNTKKTLSCEHMFHKNCINNYINNNYKCPICRNDKSSNIIINSTKELNLFQKIKLKNNSFVDKLKKFFTIPQLLEFMTYLNKNTIISGSFILSTILNEDYSNNDIDIYVDNEFDYIRLLKFLVRSKYILNDQSINNIAYNYLDFLNSKNLIIYVDTFFNNNNNSIKIDLIYCKSNTQVICNCFDLDIVKNYYDGYNFYVYNLTKLLYKIDYIENNRITEKVKNRIIKYRNRGFNIDIL